MCWPAVVSVVSVVQWPLLHIRRWCRRRRRAGCRRRRMCWPAVVSTIHKRTTFLWAPSRACLAGIFNFVLTPRTVAKAIIHITLLHSTSIFACEFLIPIRVFRRRRRVRAREFRRRRVRARDFRRRREWDSVILSLCHFDGERYQAALFEKLPMTIHGLL